MKLLNRTVCIIPARSGSKRIKNKNIIKFFGKPIITYSIKNALNAELFSKVIVSSDSRKIINLARKAGAFTNGLRDKKISDNFSTVQDVLKYEIKKNDLINYSYLCCIYPCSGPFLNKTIIKKAFKIFLKNDADLLVTISKYEYPPEKAYIKLNNKFMKLKNPKYYRERTQDLNKYFKDTGSIYFYKINKLINSEINKNSKISYLEVPSNSIIDIDNPEDLRISKLLYSIKN